MTDPLRDTPTDTAGGLQDSPHDLHEATEEEDTLWSGCGDRGCCGDRPWRVTCSCGESFSGALDYAREEHAEHAAVALRETVRSINEESRAVPDDLQHTSTKALACEVCGAAVSDDGRCAASGMTPAICGNLALLPPGQPQSCRVLLSDDGNGYDAAECSTCLSVLGPWPQPGHTLAECVTALARQLQEARRAG